jgi:hypothetical protein
MKSPNLLNWRDDDPLRWSDPAFLNEMRGSTDLAADACVAALHHEFPSSNFHSLLATLSRNDVEISALPEPLKTFLESTRAIPTLDDVPIDRVLERVKRGQEVFQNHTGISCLILLLKSLPEGYQAPNLTQLLQVSGNLEDNTFKRLLGVLQMMVDVCKIGGCEPSGRAIITAQKLRLLHAGIRKIVRQTKPDYEPKFGIPVNHEDMLGTIMGFSLLVVRGLETLKTPLTPAEADDYYYIWMVFAVVIGIHPPGQPNSLRYVPRNLVEAAQFYAAYDLRHYVVAADNPEGLVLTQAVLKMLNDLVPDHRILRWMMGRVARIYLEDLIGIKSMVRLGQHRAKTAYFLRLLLGIVPTVWTLFAKKVNAISESKRRAEHIGSIFLKDIIRRNYSGEVEFLIPMRVKDLRDLVEKPANGAGR